MRVKQIGNYVVTKRQNPNRGRVYDTRGLAPCLGTMQGGGGRQPHIIEVRNDTDKASDKTGMD